MPSIVLKACTCIALLCSAGAALATDREPTMLTDPVFRLHYDRRVVKFDPIELSVLQRCEQISFLPNVTPVWFVFGRTVDHKGRTVYATGGFSIRSNPSPPLTRKYETEGFGLMFRMDGDRCEEIGSIMETFEAGMTDDDLTHAVFENLAEDMVVRYETAFNGAKALKKAFRKHGVKRSKYAPALNRAFAPYYIE